MTADQTRRVQGIVARVAPLRVRVTLAAMIVVGLAMSMAAVFLVVQLRTNLLDSSRSTAKTHAETVAHLVKAAGKGVRIPLGEFDDDDDFVQILGMDGSVLESTENAAGRPAVTLPHDDDDPISVPFEDGRFVVATETAERADGKLTVLAGVSVSEATEAADSLARYLLLGVPLLILVVGGTTWYVVGRALAPVEQIRRGADEITSSALHRRLPQPDRLDEIGRLAQTMNRMLARLDDSQQRQRRFVSDAAHELRSPVASIKQNAEVAKSYPAHLRAEELTDIVLAESARLENLVTALLSLAHLDEIVSASAGKQVDLDDLVLEQARRLRQVTSLRIDTSGVSAGRVRGDESALAQVLRNLVDNAERHTRTMISLALREAGDSVLLIVDDDGPGIPAIERERVFERFVRLDEARSQDAGGSGLGLAIVHDIVAVHGGTVTVAESPLGGARLLVRLPRLLQGAG